MAYCYFSSDDYRCDVWAASLVHTNQIVVASERIVGDIPRADHLDTPDTLELHAEASKKQRAFIDNALRQPIHHPDAGREFAFDDHYDFCAKMYQLAADGFRIPEHVLAELCGCPAVP